MALKWAMRPTGGRGGLIKGQVAQEPEDGLYPGFSASGQDVWLEKPQFRGDGLVLSAVGARCGKVFRATGSWGVVANTHVLLPRIGHDTDYLWYLVNDEAFWERGGTAQPYVRVAETLSRRHELPPLQTQRAIADFLDRETGRIDRLMEKKRRLVELLEEKRTALISHAVTKGLDPTVPMKDSGIPWLGEIPEHWEAAPLKRVAQIRYGLGQPPPTSDEGIPIIRATNINSGRIADEGMIYAALEDLPIDRAPLLEAGEILVVRSGALTGDSAIVPEGYSGAAPGYDLRLTVKKAMPRFVAWSLLGYHALSQIDLAKSRAAQPHVNAEELGELLLALPPIQVQDHIAHRLDAADTALATAHTKLNQQLDKLAEYRQALVTAAVIGQIDVTGEAPDPEEVVA